MDHVVAIAACECEPAGKKLLGAMISKRLTGLIGDQLNESLAAYREVLYDWSERTLNQLQRRFHAYADNYRARIEALTSAIGATRNF